MAPIVTSRGDAFRGVIERVGPLSSAGVTGYTANVLSDAPVLFWKGDSPGTNQAPVPPGVAGTPTFTGSPTTGQNIANPTAIGKFTSFVVGSGQFATWADENPFDFTSTFTVEFWLSGAVLTAGFNPIICKSYNSHTEPFYVYAVFTNSSNQFRLSHGTNTSGTPANFHDTGVAIPTGATWHHIAYTYNASGNVKLYVDAGTAAFSAVAAGGNILTSTGNFGIVTIPALGGAWLTANVAALALYPTELSQARIQAHYDNRNTA